MKLTKMSKNLIVPEFYRTRISLLLLLFTTMQTFPVRSLVIKEECPF